MSTYAYLFFYGVKNLPLKHFMKNPIFHIMLNIFVCLFLRNIQIFLRKNLNYTFLRNTDFLKEEKKTNLSHRFVHECALSIHSPIILDIKSGFSNNPE